MKFLLDIVTCSWIIESVCTSFRATACWFCWCLLVCCIMASQALDLKLFKLRKSCAFVILHGRPVTVLIRFDDNHCLAAVMNLRGKSGRLTPSDRPTGPACLAIARLPTSFFTHERNPDVIEFSDFGTGNACSLARVSTLTPHLNNRSILLIVCIPANYI